MPIALQHDAATRPRVRSTGRRWRGAIVQRLGFLIVSGKYCEGEQLAGEADAAEALNVSRTAYREAIQFLVAKGLVESRPKTGTRVMPRANWNLLDPNVLAWTAACPPDPRFLRALFELRAVVAPAAAAIAAARRSSDDLRIMHDALAIMRRQAPTLEKHRTADRTFQSAILDATLNDSLIALGASMLAAVDWSAWCRQRSGTILYDPVLEYTNLYRAIERRDGIAARQSMNALIRQSISDLETIRL